MIKIIFIDDEPSTLNILRNIIDWEQFGISVAGVAVDGTQGIELFDEQKPDIVIVDIKMPEMDGFMFSKQVRQRDDRAKIIILSAYGLFEFAQRAIEYHISGYLLKPLDEDKLVALIKKLVPEIESRKNAEMDSYRLNMRMTAADVRRAVTEYRQRGLTGGEPLEGSPGLAEFFGEKGIGTVLKLTFTGNASFNADTDKNRKAICEVLAAHFREKFLLSVLSPCEAVVLLCGAQRVADVCAVTDSVRPELLNVDILLAIAWTDERKSLLGAYREAELASFDAFYKGTTGVARFSPGTEFNQQAKTNYDELTNAVQMLTEQSSPDTMIQKVASQIKDYRDDRVRPDMIFGYLLDVFILVKISLTELYGEAAANTLRRVSIHTFYTCRDFDALLHMVSGMLLSVADDISAVLNKNSSYRIIRSAKEYTVDRYMDENLCLEDVAKAVHLSKNHFSAVFKELTGQTYWDYLTQRRIGEAKRLLRESRLSNAEVARKIGYVSEYYFCRKFKEVTGQTPHQFRSY